MAGWHLSRDLTHWWELSEARNNYKVSKAEITSGSYEPNKPREQKLGYVYEL